MSHYAQIAIPIFVSVIGLGISCGMHCNRWTRHTREHQELEKRIGVLEQSQRALINQYTPPSAPPASAPPAYYTPTYPLGYPHVV